MSIEDIYASLIIGRQKGFKHIDQSLVKDIGVVCNCKLCAAPITEGVPQKKAISAGFTNIAEMAFPPSDWVCKYCTAMSDRDMKMWLQGRELTPKGSTKDEQKVISGRNEDVFGIIFMGGEKPSMRKVMRHEAIKCMLTPPVDGKPFVFIKKILSMECSNVTARHTAWMSRVNFNTKNYFIQVFNQSLQVDTNELKKVIDLLSSMDKQVWPISDTSTNSLILGIARGDKDEQMPMLQTLGEFHPDVVKLAAYAVLAVRKHNEKIKKGETK